MSYYITTDAAGDLSKELCRENLHVIPMSYTINNEEYGIDRILPIHEFYEQVKAGAMPTTTLINSYFAKEQLSPILKAGNDILHICFSSGLSATYENITVAVKELREEFPERKILLIDSLSASMGEGMLVLHALDSLAGGMSIDDNYKRTLALVSKMCHYFTVDDLFHLQRGGRVSKGTAIIGTALHIKPIMYCNKVGKLVPFDKVISRKKALLAVVEKLVDHIDHNELKYVSIVHSNALEDAEFVAKKVKEKVPAIENIYINYVGPIIGSHTGCGVIALLFVGDTRVEPKDETLN